MPNYRRMARQAAQRAGLDPDIFERQIQQESGFAEDVITGRRASSAGAQGIAQIMPATARGWGVDPLNPRAALNAAAANMASYVKKYGGYENALRAYNAGPAAIERSKSFAETNNYVQTILGGGGEPKTTTAPTTSAPRESTRTTVTETTPGVDNRARPLQPRPLVPRGQASGPGRVRLPSPPLRDVAAGDHDRAPPGIPGTPGRARPSRGLDRRPASSRFPVPNPERLQRT